MSGDSSEEKTEEPSEKKLRDSRKKGQIPKSTDLSGALSLLAGLLSFIAIIPWGTTKVANLFLAIERAISSSLEPQTVKAVLLEGLQLSGLISLVPLAVCSVVFTASLWLQTGAVFSLEPSMPKMENLNPASGLKKLFSMKTLVQFVQMFLKTAIIGTAVGLVFFRIVPDAIRVIHADVGGALVVARSALMQMLIWCGALFVMLGCIDLGYQRWQFTRDQRMSKSDVKREHKEDEGDAQIKAERKRSSQEPDFDEQLKYMRIASLVIKHSDGRLVVVVYRPKVHVQPLYVLRASGHNANLVLESARSQKVPEIFDDRLTAALFPGVQIGAPISAALGSPVMEHLGRKGT
jgi:flagellar biosynthesis protein FlhB